MSCCSESVVKTETMVWTYTFPVNYDLSTFTSSFRIAESEGATVLLTVDETPTVNGSRTLCSEREVQVRIEIPDLQTLPDADPISDPWVGVFEMDVTSVTGTVTRIDYGEFVLEKGV